MTGHLSQLCFVLPLILQALASNPDDSVITPSLTVIQAVSPVRESTFFDVGEANSTALLSPTVTLPSTSVHGKHSTLNNNGPTSKATVSSNSPTPTPSVTPSPSSTHGQSSTTTPTSTAGKSLVTWTNSLFPVNATTAAPKTVNISSSHLVPTASIPVHPTQSSHMGNHSAMSHPSASPSHAITSGVFSTSPTVSPTAGPIVEYKCGPECKSLKRRMLAATSFAVILGIVVVVLAVLLWRQHRISRDMDDPAMSRLI